MQVLVWSYLYRHVVGQVGCCLVGRGTVALVTQQANLKSITAVHAVVVGQVGIKDQHEVLNFNATFGYQDDVKIKVLVC